MLTDEQIFDILDEVASAETFQMHNHLLVNSIEYQRYFKEFETLHLDLMALPIEKPSAQFTENTLVNISYTTVKKKSWSNQLIFGFIATLFGILIVVSIFVFFDKSSTVSNLSEPQQQVFNRWFELVSLSLTDGFIKVAIVINLIVLLMIFDRKILKPYFNHRKITLS